MSINAEKNLSRFESSRSSAKNFNTANRPQRSRKFLLKSEFLRNLRNKFYSRYSLRTLSLKLSGRKRHFRPPARSTTSTLITFCAPCECKDRKPPRATSRFAPKFWENLQRLKKPNATPHRESL